MAIQRLDHINFITNDMQKTIDFYTNIIGLVHGAKPASAAEGMEYFYLPNENIAILHIGLANVARQSTRFKQVAKVDHDLSHTGIIDHFCLKLDMEDYSQMENKLIVNNIAYDKYEHEHGKLKQIWVLDPNNVRVELNFCK